MKRPLCLEKLRAGGEGDDIGWSAWMASLTQWTWVWISFRSWWWTGRPGMLQRVRHNWGTELKKVMATIIGQYTPVFMPWESPSLKEKPGRPVYGVAKNQTQLKGPFAHRHKTFFPVAALSQWELAWRWYSCLACGDSGGAKCGGTWTVSIAGVMALSESFLEPLMAGDQKASLASPSP